MSNIQLAMRHGLPSELQWERLLNDPSERNRFSEMLEEVASGESLESAKNRRSASPEKRVLDTRQKRTALQSSKFKQTSSVAVEVGANRDKTTTGHKSFIRTSLNYGVSREVADRTSIQGTVRLSAVVGELRAPNFLDSKKSTSANIGINVRGEKDLGARTTVAGFYDYDRNTFARSNPNENTVGFELNSTPIKGAKDAVSVKGTYSHIFNNSDKTALEATYSHELNKRWSTVLRGNMNYNNRFSPAEANLNWRGQAGVVFTKGETAVEVGYAIGKVNNRFSTDGNRDPSKDSLWHGVSVSITRKLIK